MTSFSLPTSIRLILLKTFRVDVGMFRAWQTGGCDSPSPSPVCLPDITPIVPFRIG